MKPARWCSCCATIYRPARKAARRAVCSSSSGRLRPRHCVFGRGWHLAIAVVLAFIAVAGGLAAVVAVLVMVFNLAWESQLAGSPAREPGDGATPGAGQDPGQAPRPARQDGEQR